MPKKYSTKKTNRSFFLIVSLLLFLSLPIIAYTFIERTFDIRGKAFEEIELSEENPCIISLPNVNPYSLEVGKSVRIQVDARFERTGIKRLNIIDPSGKEVYSEEFPDTPLEIGTSFIFTPEKSGTIELLGTVERTGGASAACKISSPYDIRGIRAVANNSSPEFTSQPEASKPGQDIKTGTQYEYILTAKDKDKDRINYFYSFTPRADWLKAVVVEDGSNGNLTITFRGKTDKPASYLAHVVIHDGYSMHVRTQSWVINVSPAENDIPIVKILDPLSAIRVDAGESFDASWEVIDLNHISKFQLYMAKNPAKEDTWKKIGSELDYNVNRTTVSTEGLAAGNYKLVVKATDNQTPPKSGLGISPEIIVSRPSIQDKDDDKDKKPITDDETILSEAQVINMSPTATDTIFNRRVTIKGTIIASEEAKVNEKSIIFKLDEEDVTNNIKINKISEREYTLIYQPTKDLEGGTHKAEIFFTDTKEKEGGKSWEFTITSASKEDSEVYKIFGKEISKRTIFIVGIGLVLIVLAITIPFIIALIWGRDKKEDKTTTYSSRNIPNSKEYESQIHIPPSTNIDIKESVETIPVKETVEEKKDEFDMFSAPSFDDIEKQTEAKEEKQTEEQPLIKVEEPVVETKEEEIKFEPKVFKPEEPLIKVEEPIVETKEEEFKFEPQVFKPEETVTTEEPLIKVGEPVVEQRDEDIKFEPQVFKPEENVTTDTTTPQQPTTTEVIDIEEPEAPDPSIFQTIAKQIEEQQKEEASNSETN